MVSLLEFDLRDRDLLQAIIFVNVEAVEVLTVINKGDLRAVERLEAKEWEATDSWGQVFLLDLLLFNFYHSQALFKDVVLIFEELHQFFVEIIVILFLLLCHPIEVLLYPIIVESVLTFSFNFQIRKYFFHLLLRDVTCRGNIFEDSLEVKGQNPVLPIGIPWVQTKKERLDEAWNSEKIWRWVVVDILNFSHQLILSIALEREESFLILIKSKEFIFIIADALD